MSTDASKLSGGNEMDQTLFQKIKLSKGEMHIYDFGKTKLHAYQTNDPIENEVFLLEKDGKAVIVEAPCFYDNIKELTAYLAENQLEPVGMLLAYHMAGASFLPGIPVYATKNADDYGHNGGGAALIQNFAGIFGKSFDSSVFTVTNYLEEGSVTIGGIHFVITPTSDAYDIEIPEMNAVYTHMMGHDCHSIVAGADHADAIINQLKGYRARGFDFILTSHYTPEDLKDADVKVHYLKQLKNIAAQCSTAEEMKAAVKAAYPAYSCENYLDMTVGFFFS